MNTAEGASATGTKAAKGRPGGNGARRRRRILAGVAVLVIMAAGVFAYWLLFMRGIVFSDDARLAGHLVDLAPEINDRLIEVPVHEGEYIRKGTVVFRLDPAIPLAALNQAKAALGSARATLASNEALYAKALAGNRPEEIRAAEATVKRLQTEEQLAQLDFTRSQTLFKQNTISQDELDRARTAYESARQSRENATQNLILLQQGTRKEDIAAAKATVELARSKVTEAEAGVASAEGNLARYTVRAPFAGWVVRRWLDPGAMPLTAQPVVSMFDPTTLRVDANIEEQYLHDVAVGDRVDISVDAYPELHLEGRLRQILRATNSEFSLIPAEGVSGTFIKVSQRVPLRISVTAPPNLPLGPGLSVAVRIHTGSAGASGTQRGAAND